MSATSLVNKTQQEGSSFLSENYYNFFGLGKFANSCSLLHETESVLIVKRLNYIELKRGVTWVCSA